MAEQQKWFIPHELSPEDAEGVIREIEAYIDVHPEEADDYWLVDYNDEDIFAKSFPKEEIDKEMDKLKAEIDSLEEVNSGHQGYKFYRTLMTKDTFEDALIELRDKEFEKKFTYEKESMIGNKPKTV